MLNAQESRHRAKYGRTRDDEDAAAAKKQKIEEGVEVASNGGKPSVLPKPFSAEEIAAEERKPKHKVAVMIGYSGSGYKGMQM